MGRAFDSPCARFIDRIQSRGDPASLYRPALAGSDPVDFPVTHSLDDLLKRAHDGEKIRIVYHDPCPDGFGAAYCAWTRLGDKAQYVPYNHEAPPTPESLADCHVAMCDCCFKRSDMLNAARLAKTILVLDHHKSSQDQCADLPYCHFDMERSGAGMAWDFFRPGEERPLLINCIEDRDLHTYSLPETGAFCSKLDALPMTFSDWDWAAKLSGRALERFCREGAEMLAQFEAQAQSMAQGATPCLFFGQRAYVLNAPYRFASRTGSILCDRPGCELALMWNSADLRMAKLSLRSKKGGPVDVAEIALRLGGGGHPSASGALVELAKLQEMVEPSDWPHHY